VRRRLPSIYVHTAHLRQNTEIELQNAPKPVYRLDVLVGHQKIELQTEDNRTWAAIQRPYVPYFPNTYPH